jgi:hypothetical protein
MGAFFTTTLPEFFTDPVDEITDLITENWIMWTLLALTAASLLLCCSGCLVAVVYRPRVGPKHANTPAGRYAAMRNAEIDA